MTYQLLPLSPLKYVLNFSFSLTQFISCFFFFYLPIKQYILLLYIKTVIPYIISHSQSAFIPGRHITDNIIVAYEAFHTMATRLKGKQDSWL